MPACDSALPKASSVESAEEKDEAPRPQLEGKDAADAPSPTPAADIDGRRIETDGARVDLRKNGVDVRTDDATVKTRRDEVDVTSKDGKVTANRSGTRVEDEGRKVTTKSDGTVRIKGKGGKSVEVDPSGKVKLGGKAVPGL